MNGNIVIRMGRCEVVTNSLTLLLKFIFDESVEGRWRTKKFYSDGGDYDVIFIRVETKVCHKKQVIKEPLYTHGDNATSRKDD